jgi:hypothetical protein
MRITATKKAKNLPINKCLTLALEQSQVIENFERINRSISELMGMYKNHHEAWLYYLTHCNTAKALHENKRLIVVLSSLAKLQIEKLELCAQNNFIH